ncbi:MAG TPA: tRNA 2-selenouridine(34) synthase MnmH [Tepidimicrobium sp.]|nr:tRNA 2-selenouridine(34) synthase MnmH [Tepidimicrobium sp.]
MYEILKYDDIDQGNIDGSHILIDVRSPNEYNLETIPSAINIPIFNDNERKLIGTTYTQESIEQAKKLGVKAAAKKLPHIYDRIATLNRKYNNLIFFCARGGFRSSSLVSLFKTLGIHAYKLDGGYKKYRKYINKALPEIIKGVKFIVLYGNTGTGKTHILETIKGMGHDVLDLEGCANHRGSLLGSVGLGKPNTQKMFESMLYESLKNRKTNIVYVEGESKRIGRVIIPNFIYDAINNGIAIKIEASIETRIDNILEDYVHETDKELIDALNQLRRYIGNKLIDRYIDMVQKSKYRGVAKELMIKYYDPLYEYKNRTFNETFYNENNEETAKQIVEWTGRILATSELNDRVIRIRG